MEENSLEIRFSTEVGRIDCESFGPLKEWIDLNTARYEGVTVTTENIMDVKKDLAEARKVFDSLETERKTVKKTWEAPYKEWEAQYKDAVAKLTGHIEDMSSQVRKLEAEQEEKRTTYRKNLLLNDAASFRRGFADVIEFTPSLWNRVWKDNYCNKTMTDNRCQAEWREALRMVQLDLEMVESYVEAQALMPLFLECGNVAEAMKRLSEQKKTLKQMEQPVSEPKAEPQPKVVTYTVDVTAEPSEDDMKMAQGKRAFRGPKYKVKALLEFAEQLGLEIVKI